MRPAAHSLLVALLGALLLCLPLAGALQAQEETRPQQPRTRKVLPIGKKTFESLNKAHEALEKDDFGTALAQLNELAQSDQLNGHEQALMHQTFGYIYSGQERYGKAAVSFEKALATRQLSPAAETSTQYNLGQLYMASEQYRKAIETLRAWFDVAENPQPDPFFLLAQAYGQVGELASALGWAKRGLAQSSQPREEWLQLTLALYFESKDYKNVVELLEQLVARFPSKKYWIQLYAAYGELGDERKAYAAFELAHAQGFLSQDKELRQLAQLHMYHEAPYKAASLLTQELESGRVVRTRKSLELLANAWIAAREYPRALAPMEAAAELSGDGELYVRLGQVHMENEDWGKAVAALRAALNKGGVKDAGRVNLLIGICHVNSRELKSARSAFGAAARYGSTRESAAQWIRHVEHVEATAAATRE